MPLALLLIVSPPQAVNQASRPLPSPALQVLAAGPRDMIDRLAAKARDCGFAAAISRPWQESDTPTLRMQGNEVYVVDPQEDILPRREAFNCCAQASRGLLLGDGD